MNKCRDTKFTFVQLDNVNWLNEIITEKYHWFRYNTISRGKEPLLITKGTLGVNCITVPSEIYKFSKKELHEKENKVCTEMFHYYTSQMSTDVNSQIPLTAFVPTVFSEPILFLLTA